MTALRDVGDLLAALEVYQRLERRLAREFGTELSLGIRRLAGELRRELTELKAGAGGLPLPTTSFVGRRSECARAVAMIRERHCTLLVGPAGVGKTRIAIRVARRLQRELNASVAHVALDGVAPGDFESRLAASFSIESAAGTNLRGAILGALAERDTVVVLDGCEGVASEAAAFVDAILARSRNVWVLATSRVKFSSSAEALEIAPFLTPVNGTLSVVGDETSIDFFADRAAAVIPSFTLDSRNAPLVAEICRRLDGVPLALELAASRLNLMSLEELHRRLEDRFAVLTHGVPGRSLRETLGFSYELLDDAQRKMLLRLAVFNDGWTLEAAEQVCSGDDLPVARILEALGALRDRSLVFTSDVRGAIRFGLLETLREFAAGEAAKSPEGVRLRSRRHAEYYCAFLQRHAESIARIDHGAFALVDSEFANIATALHWACEEDGIARIGVEMLAALRRYVQVRVLSRPMLPVGRRLLEAIRPEQRATSWYAYGLRTAGTWATSSEEDDAYQFNERAVAAFRAAGDEIGTAHGLASFAVASYRIGDYAKCEELFREALPMYERLGDRSAMFQIRKNLGSLASAVGRLDEAEEFFAAAMAVRDAAATYDYENLVNNRANLAYLRGEYVDGVAHAREALEICRREGFRMLEALDLLALNQFAAGERAAAWRTYREAYAVARTSEVPQSVAQVLEDAVVSGAAAGFDEHLLAETIGFATAWRERHKNPVNPSFAPILAAAIASVKERLGVRAFETAFERGAALKLDEVLDRLDAASLAGEPDIISGLTARESEIARLVVEGKRSSEIAATLFVSVRTVDNHLAAIYRKLGVKSRAQMVAVVAAEARRS
ncbi:MAG: tetratricopeptide repeat protein [Candidatus Eremiobacteraeota bacterium]|nr:tetratricopeptide repeat protein [Candidatus Eremiobacteraeota bacterium]